LQSKHWQQFRQLQAFISIIGRDQWSTLPLSAPSVSHRSSFVVLYHCLLFFFPLKKKHLLRKIKKKIIFQEK
ncbi:unnamed protein product, partial [Musa acuminata subsp. malaccensis]